MNVRLTSLAARIVLAALSAGVASPAAANWFRASEININRNVGSFANPSPQDLRVSRRSSDYPLQSQMLNEQGKVALKVWLDKDGAITNAVVEHTSGFPRLDEAAVKYMMTSWRYQPNKDKPMPATTVAEVTFKLE